MEEHDRSLTIEALHAMQDSWGQGNYSVLPEMASRLPFHSRDPLVVDKLVHAAYMSEAAVSDAVAEALIEKGDTYIVSRLVTHLASRLGKPMSPGIVSLGEKIERSRRGEVTTSEEWLDRAQRSYRASLKTNAIREVTLSQALRVLAKVINRAAAKIDSDALRAVAGLQDGLRAIEFLTTELLGESGFVLGRQTVDCSDLRELANGELARRGGE